MKSISDSIVRRIRAKQHGWVFTPKDFIDLAPRNTIGVTLHRLLKKGIIRQLSHGLYDFPKTHPKLGMLAANPDAIAKAIGSKTGDIIQPGGAQLANLLGLDTQVPAKLGYIVSGKSAQKKIATWPIKLSHSKFVNKTPISPNALAVINALQYFGKDHITAARIDQCKRILSKRDKAQLKKNLKRLPDWLIPSILKIIGTE